MIALTNDQNAHTGVRPKTRRQEEKERRYRDLLRAAGHLFGAAGYAAVTLDDIGTAVGVSGQAIYRHFKGKQDLLGRILLEISAQLLTDGERIRAEHLLVEERVESLVRFHVDFALQSPQIIRIQEQEMPQLLETDRRSVRRMQRQYIEIWSAAIAEVHPGITQMELRTRIHGVFGLINSTARSVGRSDRRASPAEDAARSAPTLQAMARAAIDVPLR